MSVASTGPLLAALDIEFLRDLVHRRAAIVLDPRKTQLIESRLAPVARMEGLSSVDALVERLRSERDGRLADQVVDAMTTNETTFFRDVHPWSALEHHILPDLIERRASQRSLTVWSAACSTGQEPYSLAMLLASRFPSLLKNWRVRIVGTDLSPRVLEQARHGSYSQLEVNRGLPAAMLVRYFQREGARWRIDESLRRLVEFREMNLCTAWTGLPTADLILMRNVLIYFDLTTKREVLGRVHRLLRDDGYLLLGTAETTVNIDDRFERLALDRATAYRTR